MMAVLIFFGSGTIAGAEPSEAVPLLVTLKQSAPLKLLPWSAEKIPMLAGGLVIQVQNTGTTALFVEDLQVHNLLFRNKKTNEDYVIVHSCDCGLVTKTMPAPPRRLIAIKPGEKKTITIEEWDCSGGPWAPPPAGDYLVYYRIHFMKERPAPREVDPAQKVVIKEVIESCKKQLLSNEFWQSAAVSQPLAITLK